MMEAQNAPMQDRRQTERHTVRLSGRIFLPATGVTLDCTITNLSAGGAAFRCIEPPASETAIVLYVDGFGRFDGVATRSIQGEVGVKFVSRDTRQRLEAALSAFVQEGMTLVTRLRRSERVAGDGSIDRFSLTSGEEVPCSLLDISLHGASLRTGQRPPIGEVIYLGKTRGWVVRHHAEDGIGVQFLEPVAAE
jgi:hypothetical protein